MMRDSNWGVCVRVEVFVQWEEFKEDIRGEGWLKVSICQLPSAHLTGYYKNVTLSFLFYFFSNHLELSLFFVPHPEKSPVLVLRSPPHRLSFLRFICSALLLPAALLPSAHLHLSSQPLLLSPAPLFFSPLLSISSVLSALLQPPPLSSFHLSDLSCGSRGLIYSPNIPNCTCAHARKEKNPHTFVTVFPDLNVIWATFSLSESKRELCPTSQPARVQQTCIWDVFQQRHQRCNLTDFFFL